MQLVGSRGQQVRDFMYDASGTVTTGGTAQLILPEQPNRTALLLQNISSGNIYIEFGGARATCSLTSGVVSSFSITNAGFGYTIPPSVIFFGGGDVSRNPNFLGPGLPGLVTPTKIASAVTTLSGGTVNAITLNSGGANYKNAPYVFLRAHENDPYGAATPSATSGLLLTANGGSVFYNGTAITTDAIAIYGATTGQAFTCKYMIGG